MRKFLGYPLTAVRVLINKLLRLAFQALYYPLAPVYDKISHYAFLGQWAKWQKSVIPSIQGKAVLEVGCGTGALYLELLERGYNATGVDASAPMLNQAKRRLKKAGKSGQLLRAKVQDLPFPDDSFEAVVSTFPTEYILDINALKEFCRVLYPGGRLIIVDTAQLRPFNRAAKILLWIYQNILGYGGKPRTKQAFAQFHLPLTEAGFVRRDETFEDEQGEAHIIIATKVW